MRKYERGQILLIVVLVMTLALTVGLSVATHSITNIRTSAEQDTSQRALSAAEAGIEKALNEATGSSGEFDNQAVFQTTIETISGKDLLLNNGAPVLKDDAADLWLSTYPDYLQPWNGTITIYWGNSSDVCEKDPAANTMAAVEILLIEGAKSDPELTHYPVDPCADRASGNNFGAASSGGTVQGKTFAFSTSITVSSGLFMRIIPLYSATTIGIVGNNDLPSQGKRITSVGTSANTQRKIVGVQEYPKLPMAFFPFVIFSPK